VNSYKRPKSQQVLAVGM